MSAKNGNQDINWSCYT